MLGSFHDRAPQDSAEGSAADLYPASDFGFADAGVDRGVRNRNSVCIGKRSGAIAPVTDGAGSPVFSSSTGSTAAG